MAIPDDTVGLTLRDLVLEVRTDVKEMKEDLGSRVTVLETEAVETKAVAKALLVKKKEVFSRRQKAGGAVFALITITMNFLALGPDIFTRW